MRKVRDGPNLCLFGCTGHGKDNIEHYVRCKVFRSWLENRMAFTPPSNTDLREWFLSINMSKLRLQQTAVALYVAYRTTNHLRHRGHSTLEYQHRFMNQIYVEAQRGDHRLQLALSRARQARYVTGTTRRAGAAPARRVRRRRED